MTNTVLPIGPFAANTLAEFTDGLHAAAAAAGTLEMDMALLEAAAQAEGAEGLELTNIDWQKVRWRVGRLFSSQDQLMEAVRQTLGVFPLHPDPDQTAWQSLQAAPGKGSECHRKIGYRYVAADSTSPQRSEDLKTWMELLRSYRSGNRSDPLVGAIQRLSSDQIVRAARAIVEEEGSISAADIFKEMRDGEVDREAWDALGLLAKEGDKRAIYILVEGVSADRPYALGLLFNAASQNSPAFRAFMTAAKSKLGRDHRVAHLLEELDPAIAVRERRVDDLATLASLHNEKAWEGLVQLAEEGLTSAREVVFRFFDEGHGLAPETLIRWAKGDRESYEKVKQWLDGDHAEALNYVPKIFPDIVFIFREMLLYDRNISEGMEEKITAWLNEVPFHILRLRAGRADPPLRLMESDYWRLDGNVALAIIEAMAQMGHQKAALFLKQRVVQDQDHQALEALQSAAAYDVSSFGALMDISSAIPALSEYLRNFAITMRLTTQAERNLDGLQTLERSKKEFGNRHAAQALAGLNPRFATQMTESLATTPTRRKEGFAMLLLMARHDNRAARAELKSLAATADSLAIWAWFRSLLTNIF